MAIGARELSGALPVYQTLFFRSAIGLVVISVLVVLLKNTLFFHTSRLKAHAFRNVFHFAGQYGWFLGIGLLPLAEVFALEFTVPIWTLLFAALALKETIIARKLVSVLLGALGVLVIVQPGYAIVDPASLIVLAAAACYAIAHTTTKLLSANENTVTILFYMCLIQLPIGFALSISEWVWPHKEQWLWLVLIGITALSAHYCMVKAMHSAEVTTVVTIDFLRLPLIALVGVFFYAEPFKLSLMLGGLLMLFGNLIATRTRPMTPIETIQR